MNDIEELRAELHEAVGDGAPLQEITKIREGLGAALLAGDRPLEAIDELELAIRARVLEGNPDDPALLNVQGILGRALTEARRYDEAVAVLTQVAQDRARVLGRDDPMTLVARGNLLRALGRSGRARAALVMADELIADRHRLLGADHPSTLDARGHRAQLLDLHHQPEQAVRELESLLADRIRVLGPDHPVVGTTRHNLATIRSRCAGIDDGDARWELEQNYAAVAESLGAEHPEALTALGVLADHLIASGHCDEALSALDQIISGRMQVLGPDAAPTLTSRRMRCETLADLGQFMRAVSEACELVDRSRRALGPANYETLHSALVLIDCLQMVVDTDPVPPQHVVDRLAHEVARMELVDVSRFDRESNVRRRIERLRAADEL